MEFATVLESQRAGGLLLHVTSLPSPYGIGDLGPAAFEWVDRLHEAGQRWWQALPLGPTGFANSPYQSQSSFAGNWLLISPARLIKDSLLLESDCQGHSFTTQCVDYDQVIGFKHRLLGVVCKNFDAGARPDLREPYEKFRRENANWLDDYALFQALKLKFGGACYLEWPIELVQRQSPALAAARRELAPEIEQACFAQFMLFRQGDDLKQYAHSKGIRLIGDLPFFVSPDSSDVWTNPELFILNEHLRPRFVAGVPPDYFSADGQRWGNPVYDWEALQRNGYQWCIERLRALLAHVDVIRLDHFRGFAAAWYVPAGECTAKAGHWAPGPGAEFFDAVLKALGSLPFIAEDLGIITPDVRALRDRFHLPGTKVLQFAFDGHPDNPYLPENYGANAVVYTGTHDNNTTRGWFDALPPYERQNVLDYLRRKPGERGEMAWELIRLAWSSAAALAIAPLQDVLNLGADARMNVPGRVDGNWRWRCTAEMWSALSLTQLRDLTATSRPPCQP